MTSVSEGSSWSQQFGYDAYGNRWVSSSSLPLSSLTPQAQTGYNAATNQLTSGVFQYDASGNQTLISPWQIAYDGENRQVSVKNTGTGAATQYTYDGDGHRVTKVDGGQTTVYIYDGAGALAAEYGDQAQTPACGTCFLTVDQLGSTRVVMDENGNVKARHDYLPWGEELYTASRTSALGYQANDGVTQKFTGKERDGETGLDYFGARYMSSAQGRFTSPDHSDSPEPIPYADLNDPRSLNLYTYTRNNPLNRTDPDGHCDIQQSDGTTEHHFGWCIFHTLGLYETHDDQVQVARNFFTANQVAQNGQVINPTKLNDQQLLQAFKDFNDEWRKIANTGSDPFSVLSAAAPGSFPRDFQTKNTTQSSAQYRSEGEARAVARTKLGSDPVEVEPGKWRSRGGNWQYRAKPGDIAEGHIHLEKINPQTGEVIQNLHLRWPVGAGR